MSAAVSRETPASGERNVSRETRGDDDQTVSRETSEVRPLNPLAKAVLAPIGLYRRLLSPAISPRCRYYPSCSAYAEESIRELGAVRGMILAAWRVLRCNPFSKGGVDRVADRRLFRSHNDAHHSHTEADPA